MNWKYQLAAIILFTASLFSGNYVNAQFTPAAVAASDVPTDESDLVVKRFEEYERQLNSLLKTRRDEEQEFVGEIVDQIRLQNIPSKLVTTSFEWVRNKRPNTNYPFVYFERVIRLQATRLSLGDQIPIFDYRIYSQPIEPFVDTPLVPDEATELDETATERNGGFDFFSRAFTRVVPVALAPQESPLSDNAESERNGGLGIFRLGTLLDGFSKPKAK